MIYKTFILSTLEKSSKIALQKFGKVSGKLKPQDSTQVLTEADLAIGNFIVKQIKKYFPTHNIIDEESGVVDNKSEFTWVVDPIDGTANFAKAIPLYGILIGLLHNHKPIAGGVAIPPFGDFYVAGKKFGAFKNGKRIFVSAQNILNLSLISCQFGGRSKDHLLEKAEEQKLLKIVKNASQIRSSGSVYDFMLVAEGKLDAVVGNISYIWDNVAIEIIITEAGGKYGDLQGQALSYQNPLQQIKANFTFCCSNKNIFKQIIKL